MLSMRTRVDAIKGEKEGPDGRFLNKAGAYRPFPYSTFTDQTTRWTACSNLINRSATGGGIESFCRHLIPYYFRRAGVQNYLAHPRVWTSLLRTTVNSEKSSKCPPQYMRAHPDPQRFSLALCR